MINTMIKFLQGNFVKRYPFSDSLVMALEQMKQNGIEPPENKEIIFNIKDLSKENIDFLLSVSSHFTILVDKDSFNLTHENCSKLLALNNYVKENYDQSLTFPLSSAVDPTKQVEVWSVDKVMNANAKIEDWVNRINNARVDGKELSPFEKFMFAYRIVTHFSYNEEERQDSYELSRSVVGVLNSDKLVCVGYADLLSHLCKRIGIECYQQDVACDGRHVDHCNCCVRIDDDKYNIHGIYYSDPCWDSYREETQNTLQHSLLACDEVDKGFTLWPIAFRSNGLECLSKTKNQIYTYEQLKEIADKHSSKEQTQELTEVVARIRQKFGVEKSDNKQMLLGRINHAFNPNGFYKANAKAALAGDMGAYREDVLKEIFANMTDEEIVDAINVSQICIESGNAYTDLKVDGNGNFNSLSLENLDLIKNPTCISKEGFCTAIFNVYLSQSGDQQKAFEDAKRIWNNSIKEVKRTQSTGETCFSTPFVAETKKLSNEMK